VPFARIRRSADSLYAGTENGVFVSFNDGAEWRSLKLNLPTTPVHDLVIKGNDLVVATHGRAFWILDDVPVPLRQVSDDLAKKDVHLYTPATAYRIQAGAGGGEGGEHHPSKRTGQNPPAGAVVYLLPEKIRRKRGQKPSWRSWILRGSWSASIER